MWNPFSKRERAIRDGARHFGVTHAEARATLEAAEAYVARAVRASDLSVAIGVCATCKQAHRLASTVPSRTTGTPIPDARLALSATPLPLSAGGVRHLRPEHAGEGLLVGDAGA